MALPMFTYTCVTATRCSSGIASHAARAAGSGTGPAKRGIALNSGSGPNVRSYSSR
jgi:hypothetical protein